MQIEVDTQSIRNAADQVSSSAEGMRSVNHRRSGAQMALPDNGLRHAYDGARSALYNDVLLTISAAFSVADLGRVAAKDADDTERLNAQSFIGPPAPGGPS